MAKPSAVVVKPSNSLNEKNLDLMSLWNITLIDGSAYELDFILKTTTFSGYDNKLPTKKHKGDKSPISKNLSSVFVATVPCPIIDHLTLCESLLIANN